MHSRRYPALLLAFSFTFAVASALVVGQGGPRESQPSDTSSIHLPGGARVEFLEMDSPALRGRGQYSLFFPPSYGSGSKDYPVVYFLHGMFNDHTSWSSNQNGNLPAKIERLMIENKLPEMLLVHPNGGRSFYTNYRDHSLNYEDFVVKDLIAHIESTYRVKKDRRYRGLAGTSMGGYGALKIAMKYPKLYRAAAAHSPIIFPVRNPLDVPWEVRNSRRFLFFSEIFAVIYGDPFDQAYYDANNPLVLAKNASKDLALYFDYGTADRYNDIVRMDEGLKKLDHTLREAGVPHVLREHPGGAHGWALVVDHIEESLGFISEGF